MQSLLKSVGNLKNSKIGRLVRDKLIEFDELGERSNGELFQEICFCILNANFNGERSLRMQEKIGTGFLNLSEKELANRLTKLGHRYPNIRANYIFEARKHKNNLRIILENLNGEELREWLVKNIKGLGYKTASNFLRNIGFRDFAIIDFHIIDLLEREKLIKHTNNLSKAKYLEIENLMRNIANKIGITLSELDMYLWYLETGKIIK